MRSLSFISISVAAPTLMTAPPDACKTPCSFSRSKSEVVTSMADLMDAMRALIARHLRRRR